jgi:hypothetical protein
LQLANSTRDPNLCISESEFAKTLRSGREHWNVRISIEVVVPHLIPKEGSQAMIDSSGSDSEMQRFESCRLNRPVRV